MIEPHVFLFVSVTCGLVGILFGFWCGRMSAEP
jgi:hypothetical protein